MPIVQLHKIRLPRQAVFSGKTAAWLHGLNVSPSAPIEITLPSRSQTSHASGVSLTRSDVRPADITVIHGLPATSRVRTFADLGRRLPLVEAVVMLDMALHARMTDVEQLQSWAAAHHHYRGVARLLRAIELAEPASESPMETRLRPLLILNGLPRPQVQQPLDDDNGIIIATAD